MFVFGNFVQRGEDGALPRQDMLLPSINMKSLHLVVRLKLDVAYRDPGTITSEIVGQLLAETYVSIGFGCPKLLPYRRPMVLLMNSREVVLGTLLIEESSREFLVPPAALEVEAQLYRVRPRRDEVRSAERR
jgi:hypothetical protein